MVPPVDLEQLLRELEPSIVRTVARTQKRKQCAADIEDDRQHLREVVVRNYEKFRDADAPLRTVMLRAAAISRYRRERKAPTAIEDVERALSDSGAFASSPRTSVERVIAGTGVVDQLSAALSSLSEAELSTFNDRLDGVSSKETAHRLGVAEETVRYYRTRVIKKLGALVVDGSLEELQALIQALHDELGDESGPT